ncbi:MAG: hypothetical protein M1541_04240 [Acidobacteria bacterium]|nr:hypothetical protein [Acidobacteriota bacterium]
MQTSEITLWGERGLVASMLIDLAQMPGQGQWEAFFSDCVEGAPRLDAPIRSVTVIVEPDFSNTGFGHPDAMLKLDLEGGQSRAVILEAKRHRYVKSCKPRAARDADGYNSSLNGQLELNHCLAISLAAHSSAEEDLYEPAWVLDTPYAQERRGKRRGVRSAVVMEEVVRVFAGIPLSGFSHLVITTDRMNPLDELECHELLPELFTAESPNRSCWDQLRDQYGWTSWWSIAHFFEKLKAAGTLDGSLFLPSFEKNRRNLHGGGRVPRCAPVITVHIRHADERAEDAGTRAPSSGFDHVRQLCMQFISTMSANRSNCNDAGVAQDVLRDLDERGQLKARTRRRLTHWCHTDGSLYQAGVPLARAICEALYGRVLPRED